MIWIASEFIVLEYKIFFMHFLIYEEDNNCMRFGRYLDLVVLTYEAWPDLWRNATTLAISYSLRNQENHFILSIIEDILLKYVVLV